MKLQGVKRLRDFVSEHKNWLIAGGAAVTAVLCVLIFLAYRARSEARDAFYDQYNRQQLAIALQAAGSMEEFFKNLAASLNLTTKLLHHRSIDSGHTTEISNELLMVYDGIPKEPVVEFVVFDRKGTAVGMAPVDPGTIGSDYSWREYFKWARDKAQPGEIYLSPFMKLQGGRARGKKGLIMAQALYDRDSAFAGVSALVINFEEVALRHVLSIKPAEGGYAWLVDNNERTILADPTGVMGGLTFERAFLPEWKEFFNIVDRSSDGRPGWGFYNFSETPETGGPTIRLVAHAPIKIGDRLWTIGVSTPADVVEKLIVTLIHRQSELAMAAIMLLFIGAMVGVVLLFTWNRLLSSEVAARTADLAERTRDLEEARKNLESAFEELLASRKLAALGNLALGLAHEIRNPLFSIRMNMQMLRKKIKPSGAVGESFDIVDAEVVRLNRLLGDVMTFARPAKLNLERTDSGALIKKVLALVSEKLKSAGIAARAHITSSLEFSADREKIEQILLNLVLNAAEALEKKDAPRNLLITVSDSADEKFVEYIISDDGSGIHPVDADKIFDLFYTTKALGGGLGLSIAQSLALKHGGTLEIGPSLLGGATFILRLPIDGPGEQSRGNP